MILGTLCLIFLLPLRQVTSFHQPQRHPFSVALHQTKSTSTTSDDSNDAKAKSSRDAAAASYYATHWENLLLSEHQNTVAEFRARRKTWSRRRLEDSGMSIFGASAEPDSDMLGEKIVRIIKKNTSRPLREKFSRGDVLVLTTASSGDNARGGGESLPRECLVVDVGTDWLTVGVGPTWPAGLWEARKALPGFYRVRLDRTAPQAPLRAQRFALDLLRKQRNHGTTAAVAGDALGILAGLFYDEASGIAPDKAWVDKVTAKTPPRFEFLDTNQQLEAHFKKALDGAKQITKFQPNESQEAAIVWALQRQISLIRGPPGTGKTRVAALLISTALRSQHHSQLPKASSGKTTPNRILAVTHSNGAADVLLEALLQMGVPAIRIGRPASVAPSVQHRTVVAMAEKHPEVVLMRERARDMTLRPHERAAAINDIRQSLQAVQQSIAKTAPVVVTTCIGAYQLLSSTDTDFITNFPLVVLDEAAQTTEPALICALAAARAEQVVLVGDTRQLPPTISSMELRKTLGVSPMARLESIGVGQNTLCVQYRMLPALLEHPSRYFYNGLVTCADTLLPSPDATEATEIGEATTSALLPPQGFPWPNMQPLAFVQIGGNLETTHDFGGKSNPSEAELVVNIVTDLLASGDVKPSDIAVISPYSKQVQRIRSELSLLGGLNKQSGNDVRVGTVDSFQGQETNVVIFSCVRSNDVAELGFLRDSRRLCVAITRAKRGLVIVGDRQVLQTCRHWAALLESCTQRGCLVEAQKFDRSPVIPENDLAELAPKDRAAAVDDALKELLDDSDDRIEGLDDLLSILDEDKKQVDAKSR